MQNDPKVGGDKGTKCQITDRTKIEIGFHVHISKQKLLLKVSDTESESNQTNPKVN